MATIMITGGTGTVGKRLTEMLLSKGYSVIIVGRGEHSKGSSTSKPSNSSSAFNQTSLRYAQWNIDSQTIDESAIQQADYIIHLVQVLPTNVGLMRVKKLPIAESIVVP